MPEQIMPPEEYASAVAARGEAIEWHLDWVEPGMQGAVLHELVATWLMLHVVPDSPSETDQLRDDLLNMHVTMVRELVTIHAQLLHGGH